MHPMRAMHGIAPTHGWPIRRCTELPYAWLADPAVSGIALRLPGTIPWCTASPLVQ